MQECPGNTGSGGPGHGQLRGEHGRRRVCRTSGPGEKGIPLHQLVPPPVAAGSFRSAWALKAHPCCSAGQEFLPSPGWTTPRCAHRAPVICLSCTSRLLVLSGCWSKDRGPRDAEADAREGGRAAQPPCLPCPVRDGHVAASQLRRSLVNVDEGSPGDHAGMTGGLAGEAGLCWADPGPTALTPLCLCPLVS